MLTSVDTNSNTNTKSTYRSLSAQRLSERTVESNIAYSYAQLEKDYCRLCRIGLHISTVVAFPFRRICYILSQLTQVLNLLTSELLHGEKYSKAKFTYLLLNYSMEKSTLKQSLMFILRIIRLLKKQQYAVICTTPLFYVLGPTCFGSRLPSSGSF
jgi:hypothetical protein